MKKITLITLITILTCFFMIGCSNNNNSSDTTYETSTIAKTTNGTLLITTIGDDGNIIKNVEFEIKYLGKVLATIKTNEYGKAKTIPLNPGNYTYVMKSVPAGYFLDSNEYDFTISKSSQNIEIEVEIEKQ